MTFTLITISLGVLALLIIAGIAVNISRRNTVRDGLRIMALWFFRCLVSFLKSPDTWEAIKAFNGALMLSGPVVYCLFAATEPTALPGEMFRLYTYTGIAVGLVGVAFSSHVQRRLLVRHPER